MKKERQSLQIESMFIKSFSEIAEAIKHFECVSKRIEEQKNNLYNTKKSSDFLFASTPKSNKTDLLEKRNGFQKHNVEEIFSLSIIPVHNGTGTPINYKLKEHELNAFDNLMTVLKTDTAADAFKWIICRILEDYEQLIKEEAKWKKTSINIEVIDDEELQETIKKRAALFSPPKSTRGKNTGRSANCILGPEQVEMLNLLMIALNNDKAPVAYRWIMNVFVNDYGSLLEEKTSD